MDVARDSELDSKQSIGEELDSTGLDSTGLDSTAVALLNAFTSISSDLDTESVLRRIVSAACDLTGATRGALGVLDAEDQIAHVVAFGMEADPGSLTAEQPSLRLPIRVRGTLIGRLHLFDKAGDAAFAERDRQLVQALAAVAGFVVENAQAYAVSERRRRWLEMFSELTEMLRPPITLAQAFDRIAEAARDASAAVAAAVVSVPDTGASYLSAVSGRPPDGDDEEARRFEAAARQVTSRGEIVELERASGDVVVIAPLQAHLTVPGVLAITHHRNDRPEPLEERELLASFAEQAALALDRTQALEEREEMAVVSDRDRIARDLHDVVIQRLFATGLHMQSMRSAATPELRERIDTCTKDLDQTIRDIRGTIFELQTRPQSSLRSEIRDLIKEYVPILGFAPSVHMHGPVDSSVDAKLQQQLVAVLREALSNVARHAQAASASVVLHVQPDRLSLEVSDDGRGLPEERTESGLRNARRRAVMLGGVLQLRDNEPAGTKLTWSVPFGERSEDVHGPAVG